MDISGADLSIILPACNEAPALVKLLPRLTSLWPDAQIIVVNDGSKDETEAVCAAHQVECISHFYTQGNGAAIKTGARAAAHDVLVFMDADGQHDPKYIGTLLEGLGSGHDMVVAARQRQSHANFFRWCANRFYQYLASWMTDHRILDLTSGFRVCRRDIFLQFLYLLPNGFSYPTTITMAFLRMGYTIYYITMPVYKRVGKSHIAPFRDGFRFFLIILKVGILYAPLKVFIPVSVVFFFLGLGNYLYTYFLYMRFTNMSMLFIIVSILVFLMGVVSEQLTILLYSRSNRDL